MKIFDLRDKEGRCFAFEVENVSLGRHGLCRVVKTIPGARLLSTPRLLSWFREETFCTFSLDGETFSAWEPLGDSDRYWIGPEPTRFVPQIAQIRAAFVNYTPLLDRSVQSFFKRARPS